MKRALIVDDKDDNLYFLRVVLEADGWEVEAAMHGAEAITKARAHPPQVVVSDLLMPVMDGYTLLRHWRADERLREVPFVVYTATYTEPKDEQLALDLGADAFILKPQEPEPFMAQLRAVLAASARNKVRQPAVQAGVSDSLKEYNEILVRKLEEKSLQLTQANRELAEREQRLQRSLAAGRMGTWDWDIATGRIAWSGVHHELWGMAPGSFGGTYAEFESRLHPDDREPLRRDVERALSTRTEYRCEYRVIWPDGSVHWMAGRGQGVYDNQGQAVRMNGVVTDITERRAAEEARVTAQAQLQASEARSRGILDSLFAFVGLFSLDGILLHANRAPLEAAQVDPKDVFGKPVIDTYWVSHSPRVQRQLLAAIERAKRGESTREDLDIRVADGKLIILDTMVGPLRDADGRVVQVVASGVDVTDRRQADVTQRKLESQLWEAQKMESLGTLAGGVAHDFNNILSAIVGNTELAKQDLPPDHPAAESLEEVRKASRRARALVQQILAFSRKQPFEQIVLALKPQVEECAAMLRATLPTNVQLVVNCSDAPSIMADATHIQQVLLNLGTNAWHALGAQGGRIDIDLQMATHDATPGRHARLTVSDNGCGMSQSTVARIFEPFFTTKDVGQGTGLGLSVVDGIVKAHNGHIKVHSELGKGSRFELYFPVADADAVTAHHEILRPAPIGGGQCILYVDDDEALVRLAGRTLERRGYRVEAFTQPAEAVAAFRADPQSFDLAVTDYTMPQLSGLEVAQQLLRVRPELPIIMASGYITDDLRQRAEQTGIRAVLYKPNTIEDLCEMVHKTIGK